MFSTPTDTQLKKICYSRKFLEYRFLWIHNAVCQICQPRVKGSFIVGAKSTTRAHQNFSLINEHDAQERQPHSPAPWLNKSDPRFLLSLEVLHNSVRKESIQQLFDCEVGHTQLPGDNGINVAPGRYNYSGLRFRFTNLRGVKSESDGYFTVLYQLQVLFSIRWHSGWIKRDCWMADIFYSYFDGSGFYLGPLFLLTFFVL